MLETFCKRVLYTLIGEVCPPTGNKIAQQRKHSNHFNATRRAHNEQVDEQLLAPDLFTMDDYRRANRVQGQFYVTSPLSAGSKSTILRLIAKNWFSSSLQ
jgi:hypothetical protein